MVAYKQRLFVELVRGVKAFLNFEAGLTRGAVPDHESVDRMVEEVRKQLSTKDRQIAGLREKLSRNDSGRQDKNIAPENFVWIFGTARVGSTWLGAMMEDLKDREVWHEPIVGELFGNFYYVGAKNRRGKHFIMGERYKGVWLESIRSFVVNGAAARFPELTSKEYLFVKEPNGSIGAPLLLEALPESRVILLVRDPRDVVASGLDAQKKGGWRFESQNKDGQKEESRADKNPNSFVRGLSQRYMRHLGNARQAYDLHKGPKVLVKYEELVGDTLGTMEHIHTALDINVAEKDLSRTVEKHSWENIPSKKKGAGKFYRKGTPGGWQEDLTPKQVSIIEETTAPILNEFYPAQQEKETRPT